MAHETQPGTVIGGRFRLDETLARGGYGIVWKAHDLKLALDVAVKEVYLPPATSPKEHADRLARAGHEARNAAALRDHPHIVAVHDMVTEDDKPWMVMRLVTGHSLEQHLADEGPLSEERASHAARCLLGALSAAHDAGIVHRDVKPANVMMADGGEFLLTDFGIAVHPTDTSLTTTGALIGSLEYVAPERANGADDEPSGDLFSLGATLYQAMEGVSPFRRAHPTATLTALLTEPPPRPRKAGRLEPLILALLEKDPARRPGVAEALWLLDAPPGTTASSASDPGAGKEPSGGKKPSSGGRKPASGEKKPASGEKKPVSGGRKAVTGAQPSAPGDRKKTRPDATDAARKRAAEKGIDLAALKGTGPQGRITVQDVYAAESRQSGNGAAALLAVVAVIAAIVFFAVHEKHKDDQEAASSQTTGAGTYQPYTPAAERPGADSATEDPEPTPTVKAGCAEATDAIRNQFDLMPSPVTDDSLGTVARRFRDMASDLESIADEATDSDVESAVRALAADARASAEAVTDHGDYDTASNAMGDDLEALKTACSTLGT